MNKTVLATALVISLGATHSYAIEETAPGEKETIFSSSLGFIGAIAAGPIGLVAGVLGGEYVGKKFDKADQHQALTDENLSYQNQLASAEQEIQYLQSDIERERQKGRELSSMAAHSLEFHVLFHTDNYTVSQQEYKRLNELAAFLGRNTDLHVRLAGYADPRGSESYNKALSVGRAENVRKFLESKGIDPARIQSYAYGAEHSQASKGDLDAYALERRVTIEVYDEPSDSLASAN